MKVSKNGRYYCERFEHLYDNNIRTISVAPGLTVTFRGVCRANGGKSAQDVLNDGKGEELEWPIIGTMWDLIDFYGGNEDGNSSSYADEWNPGGQRFLNVLNQHAYTKALRAMQSSPKPDSFYSWLANFEAEYGGFSGCQWINDIAPTLRSNGIQPNRSSAVCNPDTGEGGTSGGEDEGEGCSVGPGTGRAPGSMFWCVLVALFMVQRWRRRC